MLTLISMGTFMSLCLKNIYPLVVALFCNCSFAEYMPTIRFSPQDPFSLYCGSIINYSYEIKSLDNPQNKISKQETTPLVNSNGYIIEPIPGYVYTSFKFTGGIYECTGGKPFLKGGTCERNLAMEFQHNQLQYILIKMRYIESKKGYALDCDVSPPLPPGY